MKATGPLLVALLPLVLSGCVSPVRPLSMTFQPAGPIGSGPQIDAIYVLEPEEGRPQGSASSVAPGLLALIPLVPYGTQKIAPEFMNYALREDVGATLVKDLSSAKMVRTVVAIDSNAARQLQEGTTACFLYSKLKKGIWHRNVTTYGLSIYAFWLWCFGAPVSFGDLDLELEVELKDLQDRSLDHAVFTSKRRVTEFLYAGIGSRFYDELPLAYAEISPKLRDFVASNLCRVARSGTPSQLVSSGVQVLRGKKTKPEATALVETLQAKNPAAPVFTGDPKLVTGYGKTVAVLSFDAKGGVSADEAALLSDRFSIEMDKMNVYKLVNRSKMNEILKLQNFSRQSNCNATECAIEAGQMLGTQYMIYGSIGKVGKLYTLNTYIVNVENGSTVASATTDISGGIEDMLTQGMSENVHNLLKSATK